MTILDRSNVDEWLSGRELPWIGSNAGAAAVPFQQWLHFKEAFAPELVVQAVTAVESPRRVLDPFGGSGTTALTCQLLGIDSTTIEVNPFLADVVRAKLSTHDPEILRKISRDLIVKCEQLGSEPLPAGAPATLIEPGYNDRFVFTASAGAQILALAREIRRLSDEGHRSFFLTILGGGLVELSNVVVNGKGRRYRRRWEDRPDPGAEGVNEVFLRRVERAVADVDTFAQRPKTDWVVHSNDARWFAYEESYGLAVCSPPYPNSFDYTDVYNLELWMLGYLESREDNRDLRLSTVSSHVQITRDFAEAPHGSEALDRVLKRLRNSRSKMWNEFIPEMIGGYFADLMSVFSRVLSGMEPEGQLWLVVGDSQYKGVLIPVAKILKSLLEANGWECVNAERSRSMRVSAQQGGREELKETLLVLHPATAG